MERASGILLHISSLPSKFGIGTLGKEAYKFADFLKRSKQKYWQILPIGPTGFGDSPYQSFSTFAGNPYFIDLDFLRDYGLLKKSDYENIEWCALSVTPLFVRGALCATDKEHEYLKSTHALIDKTQNFEFYRPRGVASVPVKKIKNLRASLKNDSGFVDYKKIYENRFKVLRIAFYNFLRGSYLKEEFENFIAENNWVHDYALFMALKSHFNMASFIFWPDEIKRKSGEILKKYKIDLKNDINFFEFIQYIFFKQWKTLKSYVNSLGIRMIGDLPIYVGLDSTEVFFNRENFLIDENYIPSFVAGCPCDSFAPNGQIWGNPLYNWDYMKKDGYSWWIERIKYLFDLFDVIRLDHFRGFESFFCIPYGDKTAKNGFWKKGPGIDIFNALKREIPQISIIAEDLGFLTDEVKNLLDSSGFPGMKVLEFAFDSDSKNDSLPHNYKKHSVIYTSTHDSSTVMGWIKTANFNELKFLSKYIGINCKNISNWDLIRLVYRSVSNLVIIPMQDWLSLDDRYRMNIPSTTENNWRWRLHKNYDQDGVLSSKISELVNIFGRN